MPRQGNGKKSDAEVQCILDQLRDYQSAHPRAGIRAYRLNSVTIRIRIIDPDFKGKDRIERDEEVRKLLNGLPDDIFSQITLLLLLTPDEAQRSWSNVEFENPLPAIP